MLHGTPPPSPSWANQWRTVAFQKEWPAWAKARRQEHCMFGEGADRGCHRPMKAKSTQPCRTGLSKAHVDGGAEGTGVQAGHHSGRSPYLAAFAAAFAAAAGAPAPGETATEGEALSQRPSQGHPQPLLEGHYLRCLQSQELLRECRRLRHQGEPRLLRHLPGRGQ